MKIRPINQFIPSTGIEMAFVKGVLASIDAYDGNDPEGIVKAGYKAIREFYGIGNMITVSSVGDKPIIMEFPIAADGNSRKLENDAIGTYIEVDDNANANNDVDAQMVLDACTVLTIMLGSLLD